MSKIEYQPSVAKLMKASTPTFKMDMSSNLIVAGVGTFGSQTAIELHNDVCRNTDRNMPNTAKWLTVDADKDSRDPDSLDEQTNIGCISTGKDGAGTVINVGHELAAEAFPFIKSNLLEAMTNLISATDSRFPVNQPPSQNQTLLVIAGSSGGTSGGTKFLVATAGLLAATQLGLERFDMVLATVGGEMPWRDSSRSVNSDGRDRILANYAESGMWRYGQMATHGPLKVEVPDQRPLKLHASTRIAANIEFDWESENTKLQTNEQMIAMMAGCLFHRFFTAVGIRRESRQCDDINCGRTGQKHPLFHGVTIA